MGPEFSPKPTEEASLGWGQWGWVLRIGFPPHSEGSTYSDRQETRPVLPQVGYMIIKGQ